MVGLSKVRSVYLLLALLFISASCKNSSTGSEQEKKQDNKPGIVFSKANSPMPANHTYQVEIDKEGKVWMALSELPDLKSVHLGNYDGEEWEFVPFEWHLISAIAFDHTNTIWVAANPFGTGGILLTYNGEEWTKFDEDIPIKDSKHFRIYSVAVDALDCIWLGTNRGLVSYDHSKWTFYTTENSNLNNNAIYDLAFDSNGNLWLTTGGGSITYFDGSDFTFHNFLNYGYNNHGSRTLIIDKRNRKWMNPSNMGIARFEVGSMHVFNENNSQLPRNPISSIAINGENNFWASYTGKEPEGYGATLMYREEENKWSFFTVENSNLPHRLMYDIATDKKGNVWVGTLEGLFKLTKNDYQ